ncbi:MAG: glycosyltransferase family 4 protein [Actinobacteria bacterium]|nr:glycosyltransferase family 4 protein [Actinomycetota bacterium]
MTGIATQPLARHLVDVHDIGLQQTGNEVWARNIARELLAEPDCHFAVTRFGVHELPESVGRRAHVVSPRSWRRLALDLPSVVRRVRPASLVVQYTAPLVRVPTVVVVHDLSFEQPEAAQWLTRAQLRRYRATIGLSARRARAVVVPSEHTRRDVLSAYRLPPERVHVAPLALDSNFAELLAGQPKIEPARDPYALVVGNVLARKNLSVVARAVSRLRARGHALRLRIAGTSGREGLRIVDELSALLGSAMQLTGYLSPEELAREYVGAALLCLPSRYEGFGLPLLEAMAAGVPIVASTASCLPEVAGDAALFAEPDSVDEWASAIETLITDPRVSRDLVERGGRRLSEFSWRRTADSLQAAMTAAAA